MERKNILTSVLLIANVAVAVIAFVMGMRNSGSSDFLRYSLTGTNPDVVRRFGLVPYLVKHGESYRLFTSMFIHSGLMHLLGNMYALYSFGRIVEGNLGWLRMGIIYLVSGLCGGILVMMISSQNTVTVGASGAIFGLMGAAFAMALLLHKMGAIKSIGYCLAINLLITFAVPNISIGGHLGGLAGGIVMGFLFGKLALK